MKYCTWFCCVFMLLLLPALSFSQSVNSGDWVLSPRDTDKVEIDIRAIVRGVPLQLATQPYVSPHGDTFFVDGFRCYISGISFIGNRTATLTNYHLFDISDTNTWSFIVTNVPPGIYTHISFTIGVDSATNTSGAYPGDLDPTKGMYWAWNSGYIMAKLEGRSGACKTPHHNFEFHIGGYMPPYNTARSVTLKIPEYFQVGRPSLPGISLTADVGTWFAGGLDLAKTNSIVTPGKEAAAMADNYAKMFFVEDVSFTPLLK